ncbi:hypothetical protein HK100_000995, partial [Physocladia obscura]
DPVLDLEIIHNELRLKDCELLTKHYESKGKEWVVKQKKDAREGNWTSKEIEVINSFQLITAKHLCNLSERDYARKKNKWLVKIKTWIDENHPSGTFENALSQLETDEEKNEYGAKIAAANEIASPTISVLPKIITIGYSALRLCYFFTCGPQELRCWTIRQGAKAPQAAGVIHTDFEKGFIMAEIMKYDDLIELGSEVAVKAAGKYMMKGRETVIGDGGPENSLPRETQQHKRQKVAATSATNLKILDIRDSSQNSLASATNLAPLIVSALTTKTKLFPTSSARFDRLQNAKTSPYHLSGALNDDYGREDIKIRSIPTLVLYDDEGLEIYDQITYVDEYYLTNAEMQILKDEGDEIVNACVGDGGVLIELGVGSMRKTKYLLDAIVKQKKRVTYYALDLSAQSLSSSLEPLAFNYPTVSFIGLLGTYDDSLSYIHTNIPRPRGSTRTLLWLGSSIGNYTREEAATFMNSVVTTAMESGDNFLCGIDRQNTPEIVKLAYDDPKGVTRAFVMNGLKHVEKILGTTKGSLFNENLFEYVSIANGDEGRHEAYYRSLTAQTIKIPSTPSTEYVSIALEKGELINIEYSVKYNPPEVQKLVNKAGLYWANQWTDKTRRYDLQCFQKTPFSLVGLPGLPQEEEQCVGVPNLLEFDEIFKVWQKLNKKNRDTISLTMIPKDGYLEKPISLRHPFIFYVGHLPAFMDIQISRCLKESLTEPVKYSEIFERGIDPDVDNPTICHPHSKVPDEWPPLSEIADYAEKCKARLRRVLKSCGDGKTASGLLARILWMAYEHYAMHLETFLYMLVQSPRMLPPKDVQIPMNLFRRNPSTVVPAPSAFLLKIPIPTGKNHIFVGHNDSEHKDATRVDNNSHVFGWDNEHPHRQERIPDGVISGKTKIQSRQVTIGEYRVFLESQQKNETNCFRDVNNANLKPASWTDDCKHVKTAFGLVEIDRVSNWPVYVSGMQAAAYAAEISAREGKQWRVPTEIELQCARTFLAGLFLANNMPSNVGFISWIPRDVGENEGFLPGNGWEITSTEMVEHAGDGKHDVVLGGSWATAPRIAFRSTFRNWYQRVYPFVFSGFRLVLDE